VPVGCDRSIAGSSAVGLGATSHDGLDAIDLILQAGPVVKLVLLVLAFMSVASWAIIAFKWRELRSADQDSEAFLEVYRDQSLAAAFEAAGPLDRSPLSALFLAGCDELQRVVERAADPASGEVERESLRHVVRRLAWTQAAEIHRLERGLSFLATTGSSAPFIGLLGTVVGIITSFQGIAASGSASLAVVAPGIAEALIATAIGLLAAIPASIFYNYFVTHIGEITSAIELFADEFEADLTQLAATEKALGQWIREA
jgi:biopolymer transport protein TolQ